MNRHPARLAAAGFSLIELMIVLTILAILVRIGYPAYMNSVIQGNRSDAKEALTTASQILERCYSQYYTYTPTSSQGTCPAISPTSQSKYYSISVTSLQSNSYTITATPIAGTIQSRDKQCTSFTITNTGATSAQGTASNSNYCWTGHW
jgi:type IV pilus assembly protein PilE